MWEIQVFWGGRWITVERGFASRGDAEWAAAAWKQANDCRGDPFRAVLSVPSSAARTREADHADN